MQPTAQGGASYRIRVRDADGALLQDGRTYSFDLPSSCGGGGCSGACTPVAYTTGTSDQ